MDLLPHILLGVAVALGAIQPLCGYSYRNCVEDESSNGKSFQCIRRLSNSTLTIVHDLPASAVNLSISHSNVSYIPDNGLAHLPNLQFLSLDQNQLRVIHQLAFRNLTQLRNLSLSINRVSELSPFLFEDLHSLTYLSLAYNRLHALPEGIFSNVFHLRILILRKNQIRNFSEIAKSVMHLNNLTLLDLGSNHLGSLGHSNASLPSSLKVLILRGNNLQILGCNSTFLGFVKKLDLSYNPKLPTKAFQGVDLSGLSCLQLEKSSSVNVLELLNISNVNVGHVDFTGTGLKNDAHLTELCKLLKAEQEISDMMLDGNEIKHISNVSLNSCPKIKRSLTLSHNNLKKISCLKFLTGQRHIRELYLEHNQLTSLPSCHRHGIAFFTHLEVLSFRYNRILTVGVGAFNHTPNLKTLELNINTVAFLDRKALYGLKELKTLRLDNNLLTDLYINTFETNFNLQVLNLRNNQIAVIFNSTFSNLKNLQILDLGGNKITHFQPLGFKGLSNLLKLYLDGNKLKTIDSSFYSPFHHTLQVLDLAVNNIFFFTDDNSSPFSNFSKLLDLKLNGQQPHGLIVLPHTLFRGLHTLRALYLTNNRLAFIHPNVFDDLTALEFLTLDDCCVGGMHLQPGVFKNLRNLTRLALENVGLLNFSKEVFGNLTQIRHLQVNRNVVQSIPKETLESMPKLRYLDFRSLPLSCSCTNIFLQNFTVHNPDVQVVYLYDLKCPDNEKRMFSSFDTNVCFLDLGEYLFLSTALVIFLFTITPILYVKLYWKMKYGYYVFRSWFSEHWSRIRDKEEKCKYDVFISYNSSDEDWVMDCLLPNLEGHKSPFKLCLHHRDFELGRNIVDNIVNAVYSSRKTVCVVSKNFLRSEWCSLEIQLASYRLFDEHRDVLLLVFLEPISERQLSSYHRMRKVMLKKTYLQWPGSDPMTSPEAQELFWSKLRRAIQAGSRVETEDEAWENSASKRSGLDGHVQDHLMDENIYLLP